MRNKFLLAVFSLWLYPVANLCESSPTISKSLSGKNDYELVFSGAMSFDMPFGANQNQQSFLFSGAGISKLFQNKPATTFETFNATNMFVLNRSKFQIVGSRAIGNDWKVSLVGALNLNQGAGARGQVREAYILVDHPLFGSLAMGNTYGIEEVTSMGPCDIMQGSGGVAGSMFKFIAPTTGVLTYPSMVGDTATATKIRYITARIKEGPLKGIQLATSYTPNAIHRGETALNTGVSPMREAFMPFDLNSLSLGANYLAQWEKGSFGLSFVRIQATTQAEKPLVAQDAKSQITDPETGKIIEAGSPAINGNELDRCNTKAWQIGGALSLGPISFAAEYIYNGKSHTLANDFNPIINKEDGSIAVQGVSPGTINFNGSDQTFEPKEYVAAQAGDGKILTLCIGYTGLDYGISLSYLQSSIKTGFLGEGQTTSHKAACKGYVLSAQCNSIPGFVPYLELGTFKLTNPDWAYATSMIPSLTQFEFSGIPGKETFTNAAIVGVKIQF